MSFKDELRKKIDYIENEIENSRFKNLELENELLRLRLQHMEEEMREDNHRKSLLQG
jgi:hypothetical protein